MQPIVVPDLYLVLTCRCAGAVETRLVDAWIDGSRSHTLQTAIQRTSAFQGIVPNDEDRGPGRRTVHLRCWWSLRIPCP